MGELEGRVACVTGGTRGVGRAAAEAFLREGAHVVINGRDAAKGASAVEEMGGGANVHYVGGDMSRREDCDALIQATVDHFGRIDILHANAGGAVSPGPIAEMSDDAMADTMTWNFWHTFWTMRAALGHMIPQGSGRIIATSSVEGKARNSGARQLRRRETCDQRSGEVGGRRGRDARDHRQRRVSGRDGNRRDGQRRTRGR